MIEFLKIWGLCIVTSVIYGVVHDQITIRVCPEYFTVFHPPVFGDVPLTVLALGWGVIATWWMGAILGLPLAIVSRAGKLPQVSARQLVRPLLVLLIVMGVAAVVMGIVGYTHPAENIPIEIAPDKVAAFTADWNAHQASYFIGAWGAFVLYAWVWAMRRKTKRQR